MQAFDSVIIYIKKNKICVIFFFFFFTLTSKIVIFICLGKVSFLGYKVGKLIFFSPGCVGILYSVNSSPCSTAICIVSLVTLFLKNKI